MTLYSDVGFLAIPATRASAPIDDRRARNERRQVKTRSRIRAPLAFFPPSRRNAVREAKEDEQCCCCCYGARQERTQRSSSFCRTHARAATGSDILLPSGPRFPFSSFDRRSGTPRFAPISNLHGRCDINRACSLQFCSGLPRGREVASKTAKASRLLLRDRES